MTRCPRRRNSGVVRGAVGNPWLASWSFHGSSALLKGWGTYVTFRASVPGSGPKKAEEVCIDRQRHDRGLEVGGATPFAFSVAGIGAPGLALKQRAVGGREPL